MKIAIPLTDSREFSAHYGASSALACFEVDAPTRTLRAESQLLPLGSPCSWPDWLHAEGINVMLVGGMGAGARERCTALGIEVITGVPAGKPAELAARYLAGTLQPGANACGHGEHGHAHAHEHTHSPEHDHAHASHCHCSH